MSRRWWGAAVVVGALLGALIATNISGSRTAGTATAAALPARPAVGDCLQSDPGALPSVLDQPALELLVGSFGPCGGGNFGEVVWVSDGGPGNGDVAARMAELLLVDCWQPANHYLGAPEVAHNNDPLADQPPNWVPAAMRATVRFGPNSAQYASGQAWVACVILPRDAPYPGSVRDAQPGPATDAFGSCRASDRDADGPYLPCAESHDSEVFGYVTADSADIPALLRTCGQLISATTGLADVTVGGRLSLWVETGGSFGDPFRQQSNRGVTRAKCTLTTTGGGRLTASLVGTGSGPLPWA
jgi:hypothetical protein